MKTVVRWREWDGEGLEHCVCRFADNGLTLEGVVVTTDEGRHGAHYLVRTNAAFRTREVWVAFVGGPVLHIEADGEGHWRDVAGHRALPVLDGCVDVDIRMTPATNTLPIRRLKLDPGGSCDILVAYLPLPGQVAGDFLPRRVEQRYTCLTAGSRYRYEGLTTGFLTELEVDEAGLVLDYPGAFRRV